jgi:lysine/ornithine N-monooxygenase
MLDTSSVRKFYDEREWRYVPSSLEYEKLIIPVKKKTEFDTNEYSKFTEQLKLPIEPEYISYLIIPSEHYRTKMISELKSIYGSIKKKDILHILISRIVSLEQIQDDF